MKETASDHSVLSEYQNGIQVITLNRPERMNALNPALILGLLNALEQANANDAVRVIVLKGAGKAFCAGADLNDVQDKLPAENIATSRLEQDKQDISTLQEVTRQLINNNKFVIGAIHGYAVGAGFEWAINCDFTVWADNAQAFFPEMKWGLFTTGAVTGLLPRIVGLVKAKEMLLFGERYTADQLHALGVAWRVVPPQDLEQETMAVAESIAALPQHAVSHLKPAINGACSQGLEWSLQTESSALLNAIQAPETQGLINTFS